MNVSLIGWISLFNFLRHIFSGKTSNTESSGIREWIRWSRLAGEPPNPVDRYALSLTLPVTYVILSCIKFFPSLRAALSISSMLSSRSSPVKAEDMQLVFKPSKMSRSGVSLKEASIVGHTTSSIPCAHVVYIVRLVYADGSTGVVGKRYSEVRMQYSHKAGTGILMKHSC